MKKKGFIFASGLFIFIMSISLMIAPFVGAYHAITHPIETTVDFVTMIIGDISDIFGNDEITVNDMDLLVSTFYDKSPYKEVIDQTVQKYSKSQAVTPENILKPFIFSQCNDFSEENFNIVAQYIFHDMGDNFDSNSMIEFMLSTPPFSLSCTEHEITTEYLEYLFQSSSDGNGDSNYRPDDDATTGEAIVGYAKSKLGARYWWGASGPDYFDCSGFVYWTHNKAGIKIGRTTASGYSKMGKSVSYSNLQIGDVITFNYGSGVAHIGIYIGDGKMIHASGRGAGTVGQYPDQCVKISSIAKGSYFYRNIYNCRRLY